MIPLSSILCILSIHNLFDFIFQTHWMASNKSKCNKALGSHVGVYSIGLLILSSCFFIDGRMSLLGSVLWLLVNSVSHFITDFFTSRRSSLFFQVDWHKFFVVIGFDQMFHYTTLFTTFVLFKK